MKTLKEHEIFIFGKTKYYIEWDYNAIPQLIEDME